MAFTYKSTPVTPPDLFSPINDNILFQGEKAKYDRAIEYADTVNEATSSMFGFTTYGKDAEILSQIEQETKAKIAEIAKENLGDANVQSRISSIINQASNNPHLKGIAQRAASFQQEVKNKKEVEAKGQSYISPIIEQAEAYFNSGNYYQDLQFKQSGWIDPDIQKAMKEARELSLKTVRDPKTGIVQKVANPEDVKNNFWSIMKNNPNYLKTLRYNFDKTTKDVDWNTEGTTFVQNKITKLLSQFNEAVSLGDEETANSIKNEYNRLQTLADPNIIGSDLKDQYFENFVQTELDKIGYSGDLINYEKIERDPIELKLQDLANQKAAKLYDLQLKTGLTRDKGESESNFISRLSTEAQRKDLEIAKAKQDIKTEGAIKVEEEKQKNRIEVINTKGEKIAIKDDGAKQFNLNGEFIDKKMLIDNVARGDKKIIEKIINSNPEQFGNSSGVDPEGFFGLEGGVWITEDNGIKYANYEANALIGGTKYKIPLTDIQKYIADPNHIVAVFSEDDNYKAPLKGNFLDNIDKSNVNEEIYVDANGNIIKGFTELSSEDQQLLLNNGVKKQ